jgi:hypothetical protein
MRTATSQKSPGSTAFPSAGRGLTDPVRALGILAPDAAPRTLQPVFSLDYAGEAPRRG